MSIVVRYDEIVPRRPLEGGIVYQVAGIEVGESGIYGPTIRTTYTYQSYSYDMDEVPGMEPYVLEYPDHLGRIHINELLRQQWLALPRRPRGPVSLGRLGARWHSTMAWGEAGSWGRINLNVRYRQQTGLVCTRNFHAARDRLIEYLAENLPGVDILKSEEVWDCRGVPPDLLLRKEGYTFTDLVGTDSIWEE